MKADQLGADGPPSHTQAFQRERRGTLCTMSQAAPRSPSATLAAARSLESIGAHSTRSDLVEERIRRAILRGELQPGTALIERDIAARLGVSKTPVREALISLSRSGLLDVSRHRGMTVALIDQRTIESVNEMRLLLEPYAVRNAVSRWTARDGLAAKRLLRRAETIATGRDLIELSILNREFHHLIYSRGASDLMLSVLDNLEDRIVLNAVQNWHERAMWNEGASERLDSTIANHVAIVDAMDQGDPERASSLVTADLMVYTTFLESLRTGDHPFFTEASSE